MRSLLSPVLALSLLAVGLPAARSLGQESGSHSIRGTVSSASGQPAGSVWVVLDREGREIARALTADDGRYYVARLPSGPYSLVVRRGEATLYRAQISLPANAAYDVVLR